MPIMSKPRPTDEEFAELARKRDESIEAMIRDVCEEHGWPRAEVHAHVSHTGKCYCACPDGPCQHVWDGPEYIENDEGGFMSSRTCSRCGAVAAHHDMRWMP